jgi:hypothetical protein
MCSGFLVFKSVGVLSVLQQSGRIYGFWPFNGTGSQPDSPKAVHVYDHEHVNVHVHECVNVDVDVLVVVDANGFSNQ